MQGVAWIFGLSAVFANYENFIGTDSSIAVAGFVLDHEATVLIRAVGPSLANYGVSAVVEKPVLQLFDQARALVASNTGWRNNSESAIAALSAAMLKTGAFELSGSGDSALLLTLPAGLYTAQASGEGKTTGNGLVEVYLVE